LLQTLLAGGIVGMLPDQDPGRRRHGVFAPFFEVPAKTMVLLPRLVQRTGAAVIFGYAERLPKGGGFKLHFLPPEDLDPGASIEELAAAINRRVEALARHRPAQYQWCYKRFQTRPRGQPSVYGN